jgi:predicted metal-dependent hydrolase
MVTYCLQSVSGSNYHEESSLQNAFQRAGQMSGFSRVKAEYVQFKEFKAVWTKRGEEVDLQITDYMKGAEQPILDEFAECICRRILTKRSKEMYTQTMRDWLQSAEFVALNRQTYLKRSRNIAYTDKGSNYDLKESMTRLMEQGLVPEISNKYVTWTKRPNTQRMGYCSVIMRVVAISSALDSENVPEFVSDYVLYHEMLHLNDGLKAMGSHHDSAFRMRERAYPRWREAEAILKRVASKSI